MIVSTGCNCVLSHLLSCSVLLSPLSDRSIWPQISRCCKIYVHGSWISPWYYSIGPPVEIPRESKNRISENIETILVELRWPQFPVVVIPFSPLKTRLYIKLLAQFTYVDAGPLCIWSQCIFPSCSSEKRIVVLEAECCFYYYLAHNYTDTYSWS